MNGQHQQVGLSSSMSSQLATLVTHNTMWDQQTGEAHSSCQYMAANVGVLPPQTNDSFTFQDGAHCNRQMSNWQTSAAPYQPASLHQPSRVNNGKFMNPLSSNYQNSTNMQSGNSALQVINTTKYNFYPASSSAQHPNPNTALPPPPQNRATHWNQSASVQQQQSMRTQGGNIVSVPQSQRAVPAHVTTATSQQHQPEIYTLASSNAHVRQSVPNQKHRYAIQHGSHSSNPPPSYSATVSWGKNKIVTTNSSSSGQIWHGSRTTQQYVHLQNSQTSHPSDPVADAQHQMHSYTAAIQEIAKRLVESYTPDSGEHHPVHTRSPWKGQQLATKKGENKQTVWPVTSADANACNPNITQQDAMPRANHIGGTSLPQNGSPSSNHSIPLWRIQMKESPPCQRSKMQSSAANGREKPEILSSVTWNDIHLSPGCTGTRAVAVVLPLSQESNQGLSENASSKTTCQTDPQKFSSSSSVVEKNRDSASSNDCTVAMQEDACVALAAQKSVTLEMPESQIGNTDKTEITADPKAYVFDLSSVPTDQWTYKSLATLIMQNEESQAVSEEVDSVNKILNMFWDGKLKNLSEKLKLGWYRTLNGSVGDFFREHTTPDTVILSEVTEKKQLENYRVLKDDEMYSELPYRSSWLNVNKQLDDIEKEFGHPMSLPYCLNMVKSLCQPDQIETVNSAPVQIASNVPTKVLPQTEVESVDSPAKAMSPQTSSPENNESSDPYYSFQIQVLPPEEAKMIFQQSEKPQSADVDSQPKEVMKSSVEAKLPDARSAALDDLTVICCVDKWMEKFDVAFQSKCKCNGKQHDRDCAEMEETIVQKNDQLSAIRSDSESPSSILAWLGKENSDTDLCNDIRPVIDLTEDDEKSDPQNISDISINDSQLSIIPISENPVECSEDHLKSAENAQSSSSGNDMKEIQKAHEEECTQAQLQSTDSSMEVEEHTEMNGTAEPQQQTNISVTQKHESVTLKRKTPSPPNHIFPSPNNAKKLKPSDDKDTKSAVEDAKMKKDFVDAKKQGPSDDMDTQSAFKDATLKKSSVGAAHGEPSASKRTVELALFGSVHQIISRGERKRCISSSESLSCEAREAPDVLRVTLSPLKEKPSTPPAKLSIKQTLYEKWSRSYSQTKIKQRGKRKWKSTFAETSAPLTNNKELPEASERTTNNGNTKPHLSMKRKRSLSNRLKHGKEKKVNQGRSGTENGSRDVKPVLKNSVLKFSVLPNTFNLVDGSNNIEETTENSSGESYCKDYWTLLIMIEINIVTQ